MLAGLAKTSTLLDYQQLLPANDSGHEVLHHCQRVLFTGIHHDSNSLVIRCFYSSAVAQSMLTSAPMTINFGLFTSWPTNTARETKGQFSSTSLRIQDTKSTSLQLQQPGLFSISGHSGWSMPLPTFNTTIIYDCPRLDDQYRLSAHAALTYNCRTSLTGYMLVSIYVTGYCEHEPTRNIHATTHAPGEIKVSHIAMTMR